MTQLCLIAVDILLCVSVFWMSTYKKQVTWSHELDSWKGNICCSVGIFWMVTRQAVLLCTALWKVVNLCHLGTTSCTYCSLLYVCGIWNSQSVTHTPWMIYWWVFFYWFNLSGTLFISHHILFPLGGICLYSIVPSLHSSFTCFPISYSC